MQITNETLDQYTHHAPELVAAVTASEEGLVMRRDPATDACVKFDGGLCSIHRDYGDPFLGDACHFFPRITRALGTVVVTSAALSCPEAARQMLLVEDGLTFTDRHEVRTPYSLKNYLPAGITQEDALAIHESFLAIAGDVAAPAARNFLRVSNIVRAIERQPVASWREAIPLYTMMADSCMPNAEPVAGDVFNLLHALYGLVVSTPSPRVALMSRIQGLADRLGIQFHENGAVQLADDAMQRGMAVLAHIREQSDGLQPILKRYIQAQLSQALFPFAGLGGSLSERITIIGVRFATVKLILTTLSVAPSESDVLEVIQTVSRSMDHLADPTLSLSIYQETGWVREARLRAIIGE